MAFPYAERRALSSDKDSLMNPAFRGRTAFAEEIHTAFSCSVGPPPDMLKSPGLLRVGNTVSS